MQVVLPDALRDGTRAFVAEQGPAIARILEASLPKLEARVRKLSGMPGLLVKRRFLEASTAWERLFWARVADLHCGEGLDLETAIVRADEDLLGLVQFVEPV